MKKEGDCFMEYIEVKKLNKIYGEGDLAVHAIKDISLTIAKGEFITIIGESGSGKSTLLNMLGALDVPSSGKVFIEGKDIFSMNENELTLFRRRNIGFVFQSFNLIPELNVEQNIVFPILIDHKSPDNEYLNILLRILGLDSRRKHLPSQLSGGQQQRVAIGRALINRPSLILADEPTGNLDTKNSEEVISLLQKTSKEFNQTIIMITHNRDIANSADRVLRISDGQLIDKGEKL